MMTVKITPNDKGNPPGKLADAELHFTDHPLAQIVGDTTREADARTLAREHNPLNGLKLIGFGIWERKRERLPDGSGFISGGRNVTFPARQYSVNGERRSFSLLRPIADATAQDRVVDLILKAYAEYEATRDDFAPGSSVTVGTI